MSSLTREFVGGWADHSAELAELAAVIAAARAARERAYEAFVARPRTGDEPKIASENLISPRGARECGFQAVRTEGVYVQTEVLTSVKRLVATRRIEDATEREALVRELVAVVDNEAESAARRRSAALKAVTP